MFPSLCGLSSDIFNCLTLLIPLKGYFSNRRAYSHKTSDMLLYCIFIKMLTTRHFSLPISWHVWLHKLFKFLFYLMSGWIFIKTEVIVLCALVVTNKKETTWNRKQSICVITVLVKMHQLCKSEIFRWIRCMKLFLYKKYNNYLFNHLSGP